MKNPHRNKTLWIKLSGTNDRHIEQALSWLDSWGVVSECHLASDQNKHHVLIKWVSKAYIVEHWCAKGKATVPKTNPEKPDTRWVHIRDTTGFQSPQPPVGFFMGA